MLDVVLFFKSTVILYLHCRMIASTATSSYFCHHSWQSALILSSLRNSSRHDFISADNDKYSNLRELIFWTDTGDTTNWTSAYTTAFSCHSHLVAVSSLSRLLTLVWCVYPVHNRHVHVDDFGIYCTLTTAEVHDDSCYALQLTTLKAPQIFIAHVSYSYPRDPVWFSQSFWHRRILVPNKPSTKDQAVISISLEQANRRVGSSKSNRYGPELLSLSSKMTRPPNLN